MVSKRTLVKRIEILEQAARDSCPFSAECICFPEKESRGFNTWVEEDFAFEVKCPEHGDRFKKPEYRMFVAGWKREENIRLLWKHSEQYRKAYAASFPPELWPAEQVEKDDRLHWRLKDGTRFLWA
jgi:hypothetical protein